MDQLILAFFLSHAQLGIYSVAVSVRMALGMVVAPIAYSAQPLVQRAAQVSQVSVIGRLMRLSSGGLLILLASFALAAPLVVPVVYGPDFAPSVTFLHILLAATFFDGVAACLSGSLLGLNQPQLASRGALLGFAVCLASWCLLIPLAGSTGAAWGTVIGSGVGAGLLLRYLANALGQPTVKTFQLLFKRSR